MACAIGVDACHDFADSRRDTTSRERRTEMGSIGDRAASLTIGGRAGYLWGRVAWSESCGRPLPVNPVTNATLNASATVVARTLTVRARISINLPTDAYNPAQWPIVNKAPSFGVNWDDRALIKSFNLCTFGDEKGLGRSGLIGESSHGDRERFWRSAKRRSE
jgi:hypothetical protein